MQKTVLAIQQQQEDQVEQTTEEVSKGMGLEQQLNQQEPSLALAIEDSWKKKEWSPEKRK